MHRYFTGPSALILMAVLSGAPTAVIADDSKLCSVLRDRDGDPVLERDSDSVAHRNSKKCPDKKKAKAKAKEVENIAKVTEPEAVEEDLADAGVAEAEVIEPMSVYFDLGQKTLDDSSRAEIEAYAADIVKTSPRWLDVVGYTDTTGAPELNKRVSEERSQNVVVALMKAGVPASVIVRDAAGEDGLANETPDDTLDANNRRVTITPSY